MQNVRKWPKKRCVQQLLGQCAEIIIGHLKRKMRKNCITNTTSLGDRTTILLFILLAAVMIESMFIYRTIPSLKCHQVLIHRVHERWTCLTSARWNSITFALLPSITWITCMRFWLICSSPTNIPTILRLIEKISKSNTRTRTIYTYSIKQPGIESRNIMSESTGWS